MMMTNDDWQIEIHKAVGRVIRVGDQLGVLVDDIKLNGTDLWEIMHEIEKFMKSSLKEEEKL